MDIEVELAKRFSCAAAVDAVFALAVDGDPPAKLTTFSVGRGELRFDAAQRPDVTFFFDSADTARALLTGEGDAIAAFMQGRFRADGNLPLAFVLLGLFRDDYAAEPPS